MNYNGSSTIDYWRGYVNDENDVPTFNTSVKQTTDNSNKNGFSVNEDSASQFQDDKHPDYLNNNGYYKDNFNTGN